MLCFFDVDGTLFPLNWKFFNAYFKNKKTFSILERQSIPFFLITGRTSWGEKEELEMKLHGIPLTYGLAIGGGTKIFFRDKNNNLVEDKNFTKIVKKNWTPEEYIKKIKSINIPFIHNIKQYRNIPLIQIRTIYTSIKKIEETMNLFAKNLGENLTITCSEGLLLPNTNNHFSGAIFILPIKAGKDKAVEYIINKISKDIPSVSYVFGDASIDIPMLSIKSTEKYKILSYLINPTPFAIKQAQDNKNIIISNKDGVYFIYKLFKSLFEPNPQNHPLRKVINIFEPLLDKIFDNKLTANEISALGFENIKKGLEEIQHGNKIKGFYFYTIGNLSDIFDGIRARQKGSTDNGQLIDIESDRNREFLQLKIRAEKRILKDPEKGLKTFLTAISCILPSIARAQVEITGKTVLENDKNNGSILKRTGNLFLSLFFSTIERGYESYKIDCKIFENNISTYNNRRLLIINKVYLKTPEAKNLNLFQEKALERFTFLIEILKKENKFIENIILKYPELIKEYSLFKKKYLNQYL